MSKINIGIAAVAIVIAIFSMLFTLQKREKLAWVEIKKTYQEFELHKELTTKYSQSSNARKLILDSMEFKLKYMATELNATHTPDVKKMETFKQLRDEFMEKRNLFEEDNKEMEQKLNEQVITQLNQYIKDYGEAHGYDYVLGAEGSGAIMYAKSASNITADVIIYINERYKGKLAK